MVAYCAQCGSQVASVASFCGSCGAAVAAGPRAEARPAVVTGLELAGIGERLGARALDLGILIVLYVALIVFGLAMFSIFFFGFFYVPLIFFLLFAGVPLIYETYFWTQHGGATPGKMVTNIKVVQRDGSPISVEQALGRSAFYTYIPFMPFVVLVTILVDSNRRGLHDVVANTIVVRKS